MNMMNLDTRLPFPVIAVNRYTRGVIGPDMPMLGPVEDGGIISTGTPPGCWGPMITPQFHGGHEVTQPVAVAGAEVGDAIAIELLKVRVTSDASASGVMDFVEGRYTGDPFVAKFCPQCGTASPASHIEGIGQEAVHCDVCGAEVSAFRFKNGYVMVFDHERGVGLTVDRQAAEAIARRAREHAHMPDAAEQHSILTFAPADVPGVVSRIKPFMGNIGTVPSRALPDSHNCGDFGAFVIDAPHELGMSRDELYRHKTDGHMDNNVVCEGAIVICPVKVPGGGVYVGDMHAMQGNGEVAVHTTDVAGEVELRVSVLKRLGNDGPIIFPNLEDLPPLARPLSPETRLAALALARRYGSSIVENAAPIQFIGSGDDLNAATENGLQRAAAVCDLDYDEVRNRATIAGAIDISRLPGVVKVTFLCPLERLDRIGLGTIARRKYGLA